MNGKGHYPSLGFEVNRVPGFYEFGVAYARRLRIGNRIVRANLSLYLGPWEFVVHLGRVGVWTP